MISAYELAKKVISAKPRLSTADRYDLQRQVREYIQDNYLEAFSRVRAREGLGLEVDAKDRLTMDDLVPYMTDTTQVSLAVEALLTATDGPKQPSQAHTADPASMSQAEYAALRRSGWSPFKSSRGIIT